MLDAKSYELGNICAPAIQFKLNILHWLFYLVCVILSPETCTILPNLKISEGWIFLLSDTKFVNICSFTKYFRKLVHVLRYL